MSNLVEGPKINFEIEQDCPMASRLLEGLSKASLIFTRARPGTWSARQVTDIGDRAEGAREA